MVLKEIRLSDSTGLNIAVFIASLIFYQILGCVPPILLVSAYALLEFRRRNKRLLSIKVGRKYVAYALSAGLVVGASSAMFFETSVSGPALGVASTIVLIAFAEELIYRYALLKLLLEIYGAGSPLLPIIFSSAFFAIFHEMAVLPVALIAGLILGWLAVRSDSVLTPILMHITANSSFYILSKLC